MSNWLKNACQKMTSDDFNKKFDIFLVGVVAGLGIGYFKQPMSLTGYFVLILLVALNMYLTRILKETDDENSSRS